MCVIEEDMNIESPNNHTGSEGNVEVKRASSRVVLLIAILVTAAVTALLTFSITLRTYYPEQVGKKSPLEILSYMFEEKAYDVPDYDAMHVAALKAYVDASGDLYAEYYTTEEYEELRTEKNGHYVGIGVTVYEKDVTVDERNTNALEIARVHKGSRVREAGISEGDCIYSVFVDGTEYTVEAIGRDKIVEMIRGEDGTAVTVTVLSRNENGYEKRTVSVIRTRVETLSVEYKVSQTDPSVGIVKMYGFDMTTPTQLCEAVDSLVKQGANGLIFDLRDNGGGDLWSVVACASYFTNRDDVILTVESRNGTEETIRTIERNYDAEYASCNVTVPDIGKYRGYEAVVLVNENTASAAELFTAVLRDYGLAKIVGTQTYGKGSMQSYYSLSKYGMDGYLKLTTNHYRPPCGEDYNGIGITPDCVVEPGEAFDPYSMNGNEADDPQLHCGMNMLAEKNQ